VRRPASADTTARHGVRIVEPLSGIWARPCFPTLGVASDRGARPPDFCVRGSSVSSRLNSGWLSTAPIPSGRFSWTEIPLQASGRMLNSRPSTTPLSAKMGISHSMAWHSTLPSRATRAFGSAPKSPARYSCLRVKEIQRRARAQVTGFCRASPQIGLRYPTTGSSHSRLNSPVLLKPTRRSSRGRRALFNSLPRRDKQLPEAAAQCMTATFQIPLAIPTSTIRGRLPIALT